MKHRAIKRRSVVIGIGATAGVAAVGGIALSAQASAKPSAASDSLVFDPDAYTELTTTVTDADGDEHSVTYHFWKAITYVADPVDATYQSLIVSAPVEIDGAAVDTSDAPILLANSIGGYMPSSVAEATGVGAGGGGGMPGGTLPSGAASASAAPNANENTNADGGATSSNQLLALAAGYVVIEPGARGRTLKNSDGEYYGVAPAAIVDLKAAVRYIRSNQGRIPGDTDRIVSAGTSAGGALSALLGASGDSPLYDKLLKEIGAADASDAIFATGAWCPITDLDHADGAYEWNWGSNATSSGSQVDQTVSKALRAQFAEYQAGLRLKGLDGTRLTARNYDTYLVEQYLEPSATRYLTALPDTERTAYLAANTFLTWKNGKASFSWEDFLTHVGARKKTAPAFDAFDLSAGENNLFGKGTAETRHFTAYSLKHDTTGATAKRLDSDIPEVLRLMNPMHFLVDQPNEGRTKHWWIRLGTNDSDTSHTVSANLAAAAHTLGDDVNHLYYWDQGHGANTDPGDFITWIAKVTGHQVKAKR
ncbi:subtype B tannase [Streptomyces sp. NPDC005811]|uniref:subtype B tannase n=1 Tax=Streptomyces sp. NPDC005811 TaxID=3154565 RepID=UPI0033DB3BFD